MGWKDPYTGKTVFFQTRRHRRQGGSDKMIAAAVQWAERIMNKVDGTQDRAAADKSKVKPSGLIDPFPVSGSCGAEAGPIADNRTWIDKQQKKYCP
jgi:hypothetical protein